MHTGSKRACNRPQRGSFAIRSYDILARACCAGRYPADDASQRDGGASLLQRARDAVRFGVASLPCNRLGSHVLLGLLIASSYIFSLPAFAQSYPWYYYRNNSVTADGSSSDFSYSRVSSVDAFWKHVGYRCDAGGRAAIRVSVVGPADGNPLDVYSMCQFPG